MKSSPQINRVSRCCMFVTLILCAFAGGWAQKATPSPGKQLSREGVTDHGNKVHIFFSVKAEKEYRAQHPTQDSSGPVGACPAPCNLIYNTGPVMRNPTNYLIFWQPPGRAAFPAGYQAAIEKFFQDEGGTPFYNIVTEYSDSSGIAVPNAESLGGPSFTDTTTAPPSGCNGSIGAIGAVPNCPLTDGDIQSEVDVALAANPTWLRPAIDVEYFVFTPSDVDECMNATDCFAINGGPGPGENAAFCAYHGDHGAGEYAYQPFTGNGNCTTQATFPNGQNVDTVLSATSHEEIESNTDPRLSAWRSADGNEIGDKCAFNYGFTAPDGTNFVLNGDRYQIQQEWSNDVSGCAKRFGPTPGTSVPSSLDFGEVEAGNTAEKDVVIQNTAGGDLNILNVRLGTGSDTDYSLLNVPPTAATLHASESLTVKVKFAPPANAPFGHPAASVVVDTDDPAQTTFTTNVTGTVGVPPLAQCINRTVPTDFNLCTTANVSINNGSSDPDGESITLIQSPAGPYSLGTTGVTLTVTDTDQRSASCTANVTVQDMQPPSITCPAPQSIQCTSSSGAAATLNPTFFDNCPGVTASCVPPSGSTFGFGTTTYTCTATDGSGNSSACTSSVTVTDVPPVISSVVASPSILRPPNKKLDPVSILVKDTDTCDPSPVCSISSVTASNHAVVAGVDYVITGPLTLLLKANGTGGHPFSYIIGVTCADHHGGSTSAQTTVSVPSF